jgi:hypothetical protein
LVAARPQMRRGAGGVRTFSHFPPRADHGPHEPEPYITDGAIDLPFFIYLFLYLK